MLIFLPSMYNVYMMYSVACKCPPTQMYTPHLHNFDNCNIVIERSFANYKNVTLHTCHGPMMTIINKFVTNQSINLINASKLTSRSKIVHGFHIVSYLAIIHIDHTKVEKLHNCNYWLIIHFN